MDLQEKQAFRRICYSKFTIAGLAILVLLVAHGTYAIYEKEQATVAERDMAKSQFVMLQDREQLISQNVAALQTDTGLEKALRSKFGVAAAGESVAIIVDHTATESEATTTSKSFFRSFWDTITNIF